VSDKNGDEFPSSSIFLEEHDEGRVFIGFLHMFLVAAEVSAKSNFYSYECAKFLVDGGLVHVEEGWGASNVYEVRRNAVTCLKEHLGLF